MTILHKTPNLLFLLQHPVHFFALGFGSGLAPKAPGTFGTIMAIPLYWVIRNFPFESKITLISLAFIIGIYFCDFTGKALGVSDHGSIVWDEIVAMMLVLTIAPFTIYWWITAFILFRLFDIWKPFPIRQCDAKLKGGFGVMFDDLLAAIYAMIIIQGLQWIIIRL